MIYLVPGLEMDPRIISKLLFRGETNYQTLQWIEPTKNECITAYAKRLSAQVQHEQVTFVGFSFGGIMAVELAKICSYNKVILLSSPQHKSQVPLWHRFLGHIQLVNMLPDSTYQDSVVLRNFLMGMKTKERGNLKDIHKSLPKGLIRWGLQSAMMWKNDKWLDHVYQIHSSDDRIYRASLIESGKNVTMLKEGGHLMFAYKPKAVSQALKPLLSHAF